MCYELIDTAPQGRYEEQMSNLPPGFHEPREHDERCAALCPYAAQPVMEGYSCRNWHRSHDCTCDDLHEADRESEAEGLLDALEGRR